LCRYLQIGDHWECLWTDDPLEQFSFRSKLVHFVEETRAQFLTKFQSCHLKYRGERVIALPQCLGAHVKNWYQRDLEVLYYKLSSWLTAPLSAYCRTYNQCHSNVNRDAMLVHDWFLRKPRLVQEFLSEIAEFGEIKAACLFKKIEQIRNENWLEQVLESRISSFRILVVFHSCSVLREPAIRQRTINRSLSILAGRSIQVCAAVMLVVKSNLTSCSLILCCLLCTHIGT
jgi:hypothetical protein